MVEVGQGLIKNLTNLFVLKNTHVRGVESVTLIGGQVDVGVELALQSDGSIAAVAGLVTEKQVMRDSFVESFGVEFFQKRASGGDIMPRRDNGWGVLETGGRGRHAAIGGVERDITFEIRRNAVRT